MRNKLTVHFIFFGFVLFTCQQLAFSASTTDDFVKANQFYKQGKYVEAISLYESIAKVNPCAEVYYNLGNAYYRDSKIGLAILNYERAKKFAPRNKDILDNLDYVNRSIEYEIKDKTNFLLRKIRNGLENFTSNEFLFVALLSYLFFMGGLIVELIRNKKPLFGRAGYLALTLVVLCFISFVLKKIEFGSSHRAIVVEPKVEVRYGPSINDRIAFHLVEGLKVSVKATEGEWCRIELDDEQTGWLPKSKITLI